MGSALQALVAETTRRQNLPKRDIKKSPCVHRAETKRVEKNTSCCGDVDVFDCPRLGHEVWETKCKSCGDYAESTEPK